MKLVPLAALLAAFAAAPPAFAEKAPEAESPQPEDRVPEDRVPEAPVPSGLTLDTPIEALMADERAALVLENHLSGIGAHPAFDQFKTMSLVQLMPFSQGMITEEMLAKVAEDLAALEDAPAA